MENEDLVKAGLEFIQTCCLAQNQFDAWILHFNEEQLKVHFSRLVEVRSGLNELVHEAKNIVQSSSSAYRTPSAREGLKEGPDGHNQAH